MNSIPIGYTQPNGSALNIGTKTLSLNVIGDPIPAAHYQRVLNMKKVMFPQKYFGQDLTKFGPLRGNSWKN
ncbi:MAG: hypothetical protein EBS55_09450 [Flavobacteriaceae bacterium]|nr:hypothetical protein [Flavobacteriaceae bacterium]